MKYFINNIIGFFIVVFFLRKRKIIKGKKIISIYFHNPSPVIFEGCIKFLVKNAYTFLSSEMLEDILINSKAINDKYAVITFDDGWRDNLKLLPIIERYQVNITIFISAEPIVSGNYWWEYCEQMDKLKMDMPLSLEELKRVDNGTRLKIISELKSKVELPRSAMTIEELVQLSTNKYVTIGSHTVNHPITTMCSDEELKEEYSGSKKILEDWLKKEIKYFAYPNGDYNSRDFAFLQQAGYSMAYSIICDKIRPGVDKYQIPRYLINDDGSYYENIAKMFGIWQSFILTRIIQKIK